MEADIVDNDSDKLRDVMRGWKQVEPSVSFGQGVWRRIRETESEAMAGKNRWSWLDERPVFSRAMAAGIAAAIAILVALVIGAPTEEPDARLYRNLFTPLPDSSISASFLSMSGGGM
ncbi:MAG: hypothetical protein C0404_00175 [Verrucomicrobia bacterium]|nr:hypothetical protein [Verrucomicrobiota bacterium]